MFTVNEMAEKIRSLEGRRYPVILLQGPARSGKTDLLLRLRDHLSSYRYIDYLGTVLNGEESPTLGAFGPSRFLDWLRIEAKTSGLLIDDADPLFSTWGATDRLVLWTGFLRLETKHPVVLATRFTECSVPEVGRGSGLVCRIDRGA